MVVPEGTDSAADASTGSARAPSKETVAIRIRRFISVTSLKNSGLMIQSTKKQKTAANAVLEVKQQFFRICACRFNQQVVDQAGFSNENGKECIARPAHVRYWLEGARINNLCIIHARERFRLQNFPHQGLQLERVAHPRGHFAPRRVQRTV